ncbi:MAG TPA: glycerophosphodiester phosphodiesterase [Gaiellaceae bacterium]|nr:glycerophosphodiester phosphodiesterase [Gaiellaceae bacterium]
MIDLRRRDGRMLRIGHRGAAALAAENTIAALALALELECDLVEVDVLELDGALVLAHSQAEVPAELASLDDALTFLGPGSCGIQLDLKARGAEHGLVDAVRRHGLVERVVVSSFRAASLRTLHALEPNLRLGLTYPEDRLGVSGRRFATPFVGSTLKVMRAALPRRIAWMLGSAEATAAMLQWQVVSKPVVDRCHAVGAAVLAWTVPSREALLSLDELGVDGVIADDPRIFPGLDFPR